MTLEERQLRAIKFRHIRRTKWWLRRLPRRARLRRYPIIKFFAHYALRRPYLWSFRSEHVTPAIYAGFILTLLPLYGIQILLAFLLALLLRAHLPILLGLQVVSNPITVFPIWYADYQIGRLFLGLVGVETSKLQQSELYSMLESLLSGAWNHQLEILLAVFAVTCTGALILGIFCGAIASFSYKIVTRRAIESYRLVSKRLQAYKTRKQVD